MISKELFKMTKFNIDAENIIAYAETKRIAENLTKKEMCSIIGASNNFYIGCVLGRSKPSPSLVDSLNEYLNMTTQEVYFKVFAYRSTPMYISTKDPKRYFTVKKQYKEAYHEKLSLGLKDYKKITQELEENEVLTVPTF